MKNCKRKDIIYFISFSLLIPDHVRNAKFLGECAKFAKSFHIQMLRNIFVHNVIDKLCSSLILFDKYLDHLEDVFFFAAQIFGLRPKIQKIRI